VQQLVEHSFADQQEARPLLPLPAAAGTCSVDDRATCLPAGPDEKAVYKARGKVTHGGAVKGWGKQSH
jgi:hypothetical protein